MNAENRASQINFFLQKSTKKELSTENNELDVGPISESQRQKSSQSENMVRSKWSKKVKSLNTKSQKFEKSCWFATPGIHSNFYSNRL